MQRRGFNLTKSKLTNGIDLRYGMEPKKIPSKCTCNGNFPPVTHALHCPTGVESRSNTIRSETLAKLLKDISYDVETQPHQQALQSESFHKVTSTADEALVDIN